MGKGMKNEEDNVKEERQWHIVQNKQHFLFLCVSGGSRAARIASSNTFFSPRYNDGRGKRTTAQLAKQRLMGDRDKRNMAETGDMGLL